MPRTRKRIRLLLADDERLFREALRFFLETDPALEVIGYAADGAETVRLAKQLKPDVLLLDVAMPRLGGLETLRALSAARVRLRTILVTGRIARTEALIALQLGARGIVLKDASPDLLVKCIHVVMHGEYWVDSTAVTDLISAYRAAPPAGPVPATAPKLPLTQREREIVIAVAAGRSNEEVARQLKISKETVKHHLTSIFDKVGASSRLELALFAHRHDLL
jgi:two-component system, NarL family, nitrate/nitrite response regulator NarL